MKRTDELKAGLTILAGLAVLAVAMFLVSGGWDQYAPKSQYTIVFVDSGNLSGGDTVYLDGQKVGSVVSTNLLERDSTDPAAPRVTSTIQVSRDVEIPLDSMLIVTRSVTKVIALEISSGESSELADGDTVLVGRMFMGFDDAKDRAVSLMDELRAVGRNFGALVKKSKGKIGEAQFEAIRSRAEEVFASLERPVEKAQAMLAESTELYGDTEANAKDMVAAWSEFATVVKEDWPAIREKLERAREDLEEAIAEAEAQVPDLAKLRAGYGQAFDRLTAATDNFKAVANSLQESMVEVRPQINALVKDARGAFDRFGTLKGDLLKAPWKLTYKPSAKETAAIHTFGAARHYIEAANEVSQAIEDLDTLRRLGALRDGAQSRLVTKLLERLHKTLADFDAREAELVRVLVENGR